MFASDEDPKMQDDQKQVTEVVERFVKKWKSRDDYLKEPKVLAEALKDYEEWEHNFGTAGKQGYYWTLRYSQDQTDPKIKAKINQITEFANQMINEIQFFELRVARIDPSLQKDFLNAAELLDYRHFLEKLFANAKFLLSEPEEKILNLKSATSYDAWERLTLGLIAKEEREVLIAERGKGKAERKYKKVKKNFSEIYNLLSSTDKKERDSAFVAMNAIEQRWVEVAEAEFNSLQLDKKINDALRGLTRPDEGRHVSDDIDSAVVDKMLAVVSDNFAIARRYYELKAKLFKVKKLAYHERGVPYGKVHKKYAFNEAVELVSRVFSNLDPQFGRIFEQFIANGQVDVFPAKGKRSGAFCIADLLVTPVYVLLNFDEKLESVRTIAHEFGHAINDELVRAKQNALNAHTTLSTAEVASTFMEDFVTDELRKQASEEEKLVLSMSKLDEDVSTIFRQVAGYRFEQEWHTEFRKKGYLSKEEIGTLFTKHMSAYMGPFVEQSAGAENWWVHWPHFRTPFYIYSYASGLLISKAMQVLVKNDAHFIVQVKEFLAAGTSESPKNIFSKMGIDISDGKFWEKGVFEVQDLLEETEKLAKKLKKI